MKKSVVCVLEVYVANITLLTMTFPALLVSAPSTVLLAETNESVDIKKVSIGTLILVCAGEQIPLDGKVR